MTKDIQWQIWKKITKGHFTQVKNQNSSRRKGDDDDNDREELRKMKKF